MEQVWMVLTTLPADADATGFARMLVERRLVACVSMLPTVQSTFRWEGAVQSDAESQLMMKTTARRYAALEAAIRAAHVYSVPEIIAIPVVEGLPAYMAWIRKECSDDADV